MLIVFKTPFSRAFSVTAFARKENPLFHLQYSRILHLHTSSSVRKMPKERIAIIGSGNWGSAIAKIVGQNAQKYSDYFETEVRMWVFEENIDGRKLTEIINTEHENIKYLPDIKLPKNIIADPILRNAAKDATILVFVHPHQFVKHVTDSLRGFVHPNAKGISLIKGIDVTPDGLALITSEISKELGIEVSILSGANIANEVAKEKFCETTIGCLSGEDGELFRKIFHTKYFRVSVVEDVIGVELCGALKNIVAVGAGLIDGLKMGDNTKAAIIRIGLLEMKKFGKTFYGSSVRTQTFFESCGVADLITTCAGGRNRKVAEVFVTSGKSIEQLEKELLNGQKLQGTLTAKEVYQVLSKRGLTEEFPLFTIIYKIVYECCPPQAIVDGLYDD